MSIPSANDSDCIMVNSISSLLVCSRFGSFSINEDRNLFSFGKNEKGYLGYSENDKIINSPKQIPNLINIKMVVTGNFHTACIDNNGNLFTFGDNNFGQLGIGKDKDKLPFTHIPQHIIDITPIDSISCGYYFTVCISNDKSLYSFGDNQYNQLGIGDNDEYFTSPQLIPGLNDIEFIQCGQDHVICKTYSNEYYSWGGIEDCQFGKKPRICSNWPQDIIDIKSGYYHSLLLASTGYVYSFGNNEFGQLGLNDEDIKSINIPTLIRDIPLIKRIECGYNYSMCIDINNKLWFFGANYYGQLGLGYLHHKYKPTLNESLHDIIDISSGGSHTFVKTINNKIYAFGNNDYSQLGMETSYKYQLRPIQVFKGNEDIWGSNNRRSKQKSARK